MSPAVAVVLLVLIALVAWLGWRDLHLGRELREIARQIRPRRDKAPADGNYHQDISGAVRSFSEDFNRRLSLVSAERDRLSAVLDQMTDGVLIADAAGEVQFSNPAARRILDVPDPVGRTVTQVLRDHQLVEAWSRSRQANALQSESVQIPTRHQFLQLIVMPDEHAGGTLILVQDLTRVRRLETIRQDFVSNISHELRTPLASLRLLAETLQGGAISDPKTGPLFLERMVTEVDALTQMSQELLDLSRIESGQVALELQSPVPRNLLESAAERMKMQAERAGLAVQLECRDDLPAVRADPSRLEQVLVNLIHNAIKFTKPGGKVVLSAELVSDAEAPDAELRRPGGAVRFSVRDTGVGIPADDVPRIFERFYRVDRSRTAGGTGLGLSIARHIVEAHSGRIWVESTEGQGSTFSFSIPTA
jgi:two-component system phosphate regulon sensor histidine kinase PhoR